MAEGSEGLKEVGSVIPSVYYDLIARVGSGAPFIVLLMWDARDRLSWLENVVGSAGIILLVLMTGYIVGLLLTPVATMLCGIVIVSIRQAVRKQLGFYKYGDWNMVRVSRKISARSDAIGLQDKDAGATLAKMSAEATLCQNLFIGFLILIVASRYGFVDSPTFDGLTTESILIIGALLAISVVYRNVAFLFRQESYYILLRGQPFRPVTPDPRDLFR